MSGLEPEIMISHGDALRRNIRLRISGVEARLLSGENAVEPIPEALCHAAELRGGQLHIPAFALGIDATELGGADSRGVRFRGQGEYADHAYSALEECGRGDGTVSENDRPTAYVAAARTDSVSVAAGDEVRCRAAT